MPSIIFLEYPRCSTCRKAKAWLDEHDIAYEDRHIVEERPTEEELARWIDASGLPLRRFFNTSGQLYRELGVKAKFDAGMTDKEAIALLSTNGMLVKRPLVIGDDGDAFVLVGFKEKDWEKTLL